MAKDKNISKKGLPGGFLLFLFAIAMIIYALQAITSGNMAKVSFSHQVEHLVNLDLIEPEYNKKIAQNEKLVTFMGKFRDQVTQYSLDRYKYLELLNKNETLASEKKELISELDELKRNVANSAQFFLQITGTEIPKNGYIAISSLYDTNDRTNAVIINSIETNPINLKNLQKNLALIEKDPSNQKIFDLQSDINSLIALFKSSKLGIANDNLKQDLAVIDDEYNKLIEKPSLNQYRDILNRLSNIANLLDQKENNNRLVQLRSVRNYIEKLAAFNVLEQEIEKNGSLFNKAKQNVEDVTWYFNDKELSSRVLEQQDFDAFTHWFKEAETEWHNFDNNKSLLFKAPDQERNMVLEKRFKSQEPSPNYLSYLFTLLPVGLVVLILYFLFSRQMKGVGSSAMNFGKSPARLLTKEMNKVTFKDVAGADEAKEELEEIVDFLKDPQKFTALGARIPKGVLLVGPPGTGKTLIAKAVAGEADRPFYSISGSDFVEMFVGVGASRVRDLFDQGKKNAPCIIFMDEIDAVGRQRGAGIGGGHDEREQTLNQLLVEMDGFDTKEGVILMAATNRPDILDKALLRPGRFDRRVVLDLPDVKGRYEILKVHARKIKIDPSVDLMSIAKVTPGASGADLENILNEAALLAARNGRSAVTSVETREACDKVRFGKERRSLEMDEQEKRSTAFHEAGHAIVGLVVKNADPVDKVTIIPRGFSLGATHFMPKKNRLGYWKKEVIDRLAICMGGRAAEEIFLDDMSSGAQQDINQATHLTRAMVCEWGMSEELGTITYDEREEAGKYLGISGYHEKNYSEETAQKIDKEVFKMIDAAHTRAKEIVTEQRDKVQLIAEMLMEFETLDADDIKDIMENRWDVEKKRDKLKCAAELQIKKPPAPPEDEKVINPIPKPQQT